ncbi:hypothetical protein GMA8713_02500 [Grimontia marina]|uniref:Uncharacterized protein n=1 Tax=Grimontia marina TaxID=646534 RepID=A0A128F8P1_9GAMM|nr:hypothetical protein GMA8713_02500 [Grimontia marina]
MSDPITKANLQFEKLPFWYHCFSIAVFLIPYVSIEFSI